MVAHTCGREAHKTVGMKHQYWVDEREAGGGLEDSFEMECKVFLQEDGLMELGVEEED